MSSYVTIDAVNVNSDPLTCVRWFLRAQGLADVGGGTLWFDGWDDDAPDARTMTAVRVHPGSAISVHVVDDGAMLGVYEDLAALAAEQAAFSAEDLRAELHLVPDAP